MIDFSLEQHDLKIAHGDFELCSTDTEAIAQSLSIRLKTIAHEWFMNSDVGIPYLSHIFGQKSNPRLLQQLIMPALTNAAGVKSIKDFTVAHKDNRALEITFTALLDNQKIVAVNEAIGF